MLDDTQKFKGGIKLLKLLKIFKADLPTVIPSNYCRVLGVEKQESPHTNSLRMWPIKQKFIRTKLIKIIERRQSICFAWLEKAYKTQKSRRHQLI